MNVLLFFGTAAILFALNPALAVLTLIPGPLLVAVVRFIGKHVFAAF